MVTPPVKDGKANPDILTAAAICRGGPGLPHGRRAGGGGAGLRHPDGPAGGQDRRPGNIYVATAKKLLYGTVDIDMIAGPSEILIWRIKAPTPLYVAADLMSQAEHDRLASAILITTSEKLAEETVQELSRQMQHLSRREIIDESLNNYGAIIVCDDMDTAVALANQVAPEHLELLVDNPFLYLGQIDNAGSVFLGHFFARTAGGLLRRPEPRPAHQRHRPVLLPLSVDTFTKKSSFIYYTKDALRAASGDIVTLPRKRA